MSGVLPGEAGTEDFTACARLADDLSESEPGLGCQRGAVLRLVGWRRGCPWVISEVGQKQKFTE